MNDLFDQLVEDYFEADAELLPDGAIEKIRTGEAIEIVTVKGASQLDIKTIVDLLTAVVGLIAAVSPLLPKKSKTNVREQTKKVIREKYSAISAALSEDDLNSFIDDVVQAVRE